MLVGRHDSSKCSFIIISVFTAYLVLQNNPFVFEGVIALPHVEVPVDIDEHIPADFHNQVSPIPSLNNINTYILLFQSSRSTSRRQSFRNTTTTAAPTLS